MERMQKHIIAFPTTAQHLAGELTPPHHSCPGHTQSPFPPLTPVPVALTSAEFTEFIKNIIIYIQEFSSTI